MKAMRSIGLIAAVALAVGASACGGGGGASSIPAAFNGAASGVPANLLVHDWGKGMLTGATYAGTVSNAHLTVNVLVHQQNAAGLVQYAQDVSNPMSGSYRQYLTPQEIDQRYGASPSDYNKVAQYFASQGLAVAGWPQHMLLSVAGDQAAMERAFGVKFGRYTLHGQSFIAPMNAPHFSSVIPVDDISHIVSYHPSGYMIPSPPHASNGFADGYTAPVVRAAFDFVGAYKQGFNGTGITIGIIGTGPIDVGGTSGDLDLDALVAATGKFSVAKVTEVPVTPSGVAAGLQVSGIETPAPGASAPPNPNSGFPYSGDFSSPPPVTAPCNSGENPDYTTCNPEDGEAQLDVQQTATLAPGANVHFYLAYNANDNCGVYYPNTCAAGSGQQYIGITESDAEIQQAIADNTADVISISYGLGETQYGWSSFVGSYSQLEFAAMAAEGMAVFVSSGDTGSAECLPSTSTGYLGQQCVSYPSGDPNVTSVGGITAPLDSFGNPTAPFVAWGVSTYDTGYGSIQGSGGGTSTLVAAPPWQSQFIQTAPTMREQPDVSMIGDPNTGVTYFVNAQYGGLINSIGGTSVAAPEMAAMWADLLSACKQNPSANACANGAPSGTAWRLGNAAPYLYAIYGGGKYTIPANGNIPSYGQFKPLLGYSSVFYDILYGDNQMQNPNQPSGNPIPGYPAMTGYDEVSGVGVPYAGHLIQAVTGITVP